MRELERRSWTAPDRVRYRVRVTEQMINSGEYVRNLRRIHFESEDGRVDGATIVSGYFTLDLASSIELYDLWRRAVGYGGEPIGG